MGFKHIFTLSLIWICSLSLLAQKSHISFQQPGDPANSNSNAILIKLGAAMDENPKRLKISIAYNEMLEVRTPEMKSPEVTIRFTDVHAFKTPAYRSFSMEDILTPDLLSCNLNLIDLPDSNVLRQYRLNELRVSQLSLGYLSSDIPVVAPGKYAVTLSEIAFQYSDLALGEFRKRIQLIDDYYAASALTDSLLEITDRYNSLTTYDLPEKFILLMEINRVVKLITDHHFGEILPLQENDPEKFAEKFLRLDKFSRSATMTFEEQVMSPGAIHWSGNLDLLIDEYISHLITYLQKAMLLNGIRGGIYKDYTDTWFLTPGFRNEEMVFKGLLQKMYPGEDPAIIIPVITQAVWNAYLKRARKMIDGSNFVGAMFLLDHASSFRAQIPNQVQPDYKPLQVEAVKGVYASYLGIAESCIDIQEFQMAEEYINQAGTYVAEYKCVIPTDTMFQRVFRKLFNRRLQGCDYILAENQFQEALECYQLFSLSYPLEMIAYVNDHLHSREQQALRGLFYQARNRTNELIKSREIETALIYYDEACRYQEVIPGDVEIRIASQKLNSRMLPIRYKQLADRATYLYMTYNHEEAFRTFNQMKEVGVRIGIPEDTALNRMYLESYKYHMLNEISMATGMIWKDELESAKDYALEVETVIDLYNLETDPDLQSALRSYRSKIDLKACLGVKEEAEFLAIRAWKNIELKQFDIAVKQLGEARRKAQQHPECTFEVKVYNDSIKKYISAAFYQEKQKQALNQVALGNFREAIQRVSDNERFYRNTELENFGVPFVSMLDFVANSSRIPMYEEALIFFSKNGDSFAAWNCLTWLKRDGVDSRDVRDQQEHIGSALSTHDFELFPESDPEVRLRSYTGGNRWFLKFAQAYISRWQQLQSEKLLKTP